MLCSSGSQSVSCGARGGVLWQASSPDGAGSFSVLLTSKMLKISLKHVAKGSFASQEPSETG